MPRSAEISNAELLVALLRTAQDAIIVWRLGGEIELWNRGAEELYGYSSAEAVGRRTHELLKTDKAQAIESGLGQNGSWSGELRHTAKSGRQIIVTAHDSH